MGVTHILQEDEDDCGPTCIAMTTGISLNQVKKQVPIHKRGTYAPQLASYILSQGYRVEYTYFNPNVTTLKEEGKNAEYLRDKIRGMRCKDDDCRKAYSYMYHYLGQGRLQVQIPTVTLLEHYLDNGYAGIALMTNVYMSEDTKTWLNYHFTVLVSHTDTDFVIYDPEEKEPLVIPKEKYLLSVFALCSSSAIDYGSIVWIKEELRSHIN